MLRPLTVFVLVLLLRLPALGNSGLPFLTFGQLPRGSALGEAYTAASGDITSLGFNPAGLASLDKGQFVLMHKSWISDVYMNYGGVAMPAGKNVFALGLLLNTTPNIELRDGATLQPIGITDANDAALSLGWSRRLKNFDLGMAGRFQYEKIYLSSASGWSLDLGAQRSLSGWRIGAALLNWGPDMKFSQEKFSLPIQLRLGVSREFSKLFLQGKWLILADVVKAEAIDPYFCLGAEYAYQDYFFARLGYRSKQESRNTVSLGAGFKYRKHRLDYSFLPFGSDLGSSHQVALILGF